MFKENPKILSKEEEEKQKEKEEKEREATETGKKVALEEESKRAIDSLIRQINETVSEEELEGFIQKLREYRQSKPAE